ncbi:MAG: AmmeMemoRadiSam system protein B, partial [Candidatus Hadarchaeota archaeon]|nr:AmmeMemoRadiSam system protein B [Candidatus Hadarchaeota archaeon]
MRPPAVAGQFYAGSESALKEQIEGCYTHELGPGKVPKVQAGPRKLLGLISPHAGYLYSGPVAAHGFARLAEDGKP